MPDHSASTFAPQPTLIPELADPHRGPSQQRTAQPDVVCTIETKIASALVRYHELLEERNVLLDGEVERLRRAARAYRVRFVDARDIEHVEEGDGVGNAEAEAEVEGEPTVTPQMTGARSAKDSLMHAANDAIVAMPTASPETGEAVRTDRFKLRPGKSKADRGARNKEKSKSTAADSHSSAAAAPPSSILPPTASKKRPQPEAVTTNQYTRPLKRRLTLVSASLGSPAGSPGFKALARSSDVHKPTVEPGSQMKPWNFPAVATEEPAVFVSQNESAPVNADPAGDRQCTDTTLSVKTTKLTSVPASASVQPQPGPLAADPSRVEALAEPSYVPRLALESGSRMNTWNIAL